MNPPFQRVALIGKYRPVASGRSQVGTPTGILHAVAQCVLQQGCELFVEAATAEGAALGAYYATVQAAEIARCCDLAVVVGGDGTMLGAARMLAPAGVPLVGINQGRLGFITDVALEAMRTVLPAMLRGQYTAERRALMQARVLRAGCTVFEALALNDVVINRGSTAGMVELRIEVDGHFVSNQRADGLIVASPTGSTAYALSAGGPLLHPGIAGWVLVPIAPHTLSNRPIVLPDAGEVAIELAGGRDASANFDTQSLAALLPADRVVVRRSQHEAVFLHPQGWSYFDTLREKLYWNKRGD